MSGAEWEIYQLVNFSPGCTDYLDASNAPGLHFLTLTENFSPFWLGIVWNTKRGVNGATFVNFESAIITSRPIHFVSNAHTVITGLTGFKNLEVHHFGVFMEAFSGGFVELFLLCRSESTHQDDGAGWNTRKWWYVLIRDNTPNDQEG